MILTGEEIKSRLGKDIVISDYDESRLNPNSYNLRLDNKLLVYKDKILDMKKPNECEKLIIPEDGLILEPGKLYLAKTIEHTITHNLVPLLEGRSSVGRLGLFVHVTAGFGDNGFCGYWTLELHCVQPIKIYPGVEICQIYYHTTLGDKGKEYKGKYNFNEDIQPSMLYKDFEK